MRFTKMHGCGNDYVYVDCFAEPFPKNTASLAKAMSDRHFGIGSDGLILVCPSETADVRMRMFNADGSEAEMCGNGIRCVAKLAFDRGLTKKNPMKVQTGRGVLTLQLKLHEGKVQRVTVNMGQPVLDADKIPVSLPQPPEANRIVDFPLDKYIALESPAGWMQKCGLDSRMTCVSTGNPHAIIFCQSVDAVPLETIGPILETHPVFPRRINVHFVEVQSATMVKMRTWERGSGITLACGTGACAVAVAAALTGRTDRRVLAHLPGGDLELDWNADDHVYMTGPAEEVFSGEWKCD